MPRKDYLPTRTAELIDWAVSFIANLAELAVPLNVPEAVIEAYQTTLAAAQASVALASNPVTRTRPNIELNRENIQALRDATRAIVRQIQARPETTNAQRETLDITVPDRKPTPHPAPSEMPDVQMVAAIGNTIAIKIRRADGGRGRPVGTTGANVYYAVSPTVPTTPTAWTHAGQATRMSHQVLLPQSTPAGATVWLAANWYNGRGEVGPLSDAASTNLPGGQARVAG